MEKLGEQENKKRTEIEEDRNFVYLGYVYKTGFQTE